MEYIGSFLKRFILPRITSRIPLLPQIPITCFSRSAFSPLSHDPIPSPPSPPPLSPRSSFPINPNQIRTQKRKRKGQNRTGKTDHPTPVFSPLPPAHRPNPNFHHGTVLACQRRRHRRRRRRNRPFPRHLAPDRRVGGRVRQGAPYQRYCKGLPGSSRGVGEKGEMNEREDLKGRKEGRKRKKEKRDSQNRNN